MLEFDTDEDLHTIMQYKRSEYKRKNCYAPVLVDIDYLAEKNEAKCKLVAEIFMLSIGLPFNYENS